MVGDDGEQFGVMDTREAIRTARERGMDLVEVAPKTPAKSEAKERWTEKKAH